MRRDQSFNLISFFKYLFIVFVFLVCFFVRNDDASLASTVSVDGDVYVDNGSDLGVTGEDKIEVLGGSVVVVGNGDTNIGGGRKISDYSGENNLSWDEFKSLMNNRIDSLVNEYGRELNDSSDTDNRRSWIDRWRDWIGWERPFSVSGNFDLNPKNVPEGEVWVRDGDTTINSANFSGLGTIVLNSGNLIVNGDIAYGDNSSLGIVVRSGNVCVRSDVENLVGLYYVPEGKIEIKENCE